MIDVLRQLLSGGLPGPAEGGRDAVEVALAALLVEAPNSDPHFAASARATIARLRERRCGLSPEGARELPPAG